MQICFTNSIRTLIAASVLLLIAPVAMATQSIALLVERPTADNLPLSIATAQSALTNFVKKHGRDAEIAVISYSTTADVLQPFTPLSEDTLASLANGLKSSGPRSDGVNAASGMERAIALLNSDAKPASEKVMLVISDANISTGDAELDQQFTEWLTLIISEDAVKSGIDVRWHPVTQNANHENIDAFLEKLNGQRVVVSPAQMCIRDRDIDPGNEAATQALEKISQQ